MNLKPVIALDIDGTMGDYHGHFLRFAQEWYGREMPDPYANTQGVPLWQYMKTSRRKYNECKLAFRQGGLKRSMPCYNAMSEMTQWMRGHGVEVWICTTRPFLRLDNIDPDTREWLRRNRIRYDYAIYGNDKYRQLAKLVGVERVIGVVDDLPDLLDQAHKVGLRNLMLRDQPYNRTAVGPWHRVGNATDIIHEIHQELYVRSR